MVTSALRGRLEQVLSAGAATATGGGWAPKWNSPADEAPSDGAPPSGPGCGTPCHGLPSAACLCAPRPPVHTLPPARTRPRSIVGARSALVFDLAPLQRAAKHSAAPAVLGTQLSPAHAGILVLQFTGSPVDAGLLAAAALVRERQSGATVSSAALAAADCPASLGPRGGANYSEVRHAFRFTLLPLLRGTGAVWRRLQPSPQRRCSVSTVQACLTVSGLAPALQLELVLPAGTAYSAESEASRLHTALSLPFTSALDFTIALPRRQATADALVATTAGEVSQFGLRSARFALWYPHGVAATVAPAQLRAALAVQEVASAFGDGTPAAPVDVDFDVEVPEGCATQRHSMRPARTAGTPCAWMSRPALLNNLQCCRDSAFPVVNAKLLPGRTYRVSSSAADDVTSTPFFGSQPLTTQVPGAPDTFQFTTQAIAPGFEAVGVEGGDYVEFRAVEPAVRASMLLLPAERLASSSRAHSECKALLSARRCSPAEGGAACAYRRRVSRVVSSSDKVQPWDGTVFCARACLLCVTRTQPTRGAQHEVHNTRCTTRAGPRR